MNRPLDRIDIDVGRFAVGQGVTRNEDPVLVRGKGRYTDDISVPGQLYLAMVRSQVAHGFIRSIDRSAAAAMPGVRAIYVQADLTAAGYGTLNVRVPHTNANGTPIRKGQRPALAEDKVTFVGDPIACVVADTALAAQDAAEAVIIDIDSLPAVTSAKEAAKSGAPEIHSEAPGNIGLDYRFGDMSAVDKVFASAFHTTRIEAPSSRVVVNPMEPRAALAEFDKKAGKYTLTLGSQGVFGLRAALAGDILKVPPEKLRIITPHVGGSFGMKAGAFPEYICLLHAAKTLGRPVKWTDRRSESFVSDHHGRDHEMTAELALDKNGRFLAVRITGFSNLGAYINHVGPLPGTGNVAKNTVSVYRTPLIAVASKAVFTNTPPIGPYRGAGRPEGNYYMERLIEAAAVEMGIDSVRLRRKNHIRPQDMPYAAPSAVTYDSGDFTALLDEVLKAADWDGFRERKKHSRKIGRLRGRGIGQYLEVTAPPMKEMGGLRFEADGTVTILTGTLDYGQGHWTPFAQILHQQTGIPFERIRLVQGDSDQLVAGGGTGGSKSLMASGSAIVEASAKLIARGKLTAGHFLETASEDIEFAEGRFQVVGTDRGLTVMELAENLARSSALPPGVPGDLNITHIHEASPAAYPNGCHIAEVEVDPQTGVVEVVKYTASGDFGVIVNPLLVEGQTHGGIVQGIGQILLERTVFDESGQLLTGSFMDYCMPRADNAPNFAFINHPVPATTNALGVKGCGEAGCAGAMPAVMNALIDALRDLGVTTIDMPATPERVWQAIQTAERARAKGDQ